VAEPALAQTPAAPTPNKGDTAWMLTASVLVLLMTIPGLALFYGGLVRTKNMLSMLMQVFYTVCIVCIIWVLYGYSLAFTEGTSYNSFFGGLSKAFLSGVSAESNVETFSDGVVIPEYVYICFQMTFAAITPALIVGAMAERMKFSAIAVFIPLWVTFVYFPIAHMVWYWAGPAATVSALKAVAGATGDGKAAAEAALATVQANAGLAFGWGALDFAGGTVVHINAGIAGLVCAIFLGKRTGYGTENMAPHNLVYSVIGASLLWVGWFGFNAGSAVAANAGAGMAMAVTQIATAAAALSWMFIEWLVHKKPSVLGIISGAVAGLVAITPASGFVGPMGALWIGIAAGLICFFASTTVKKAIGYDDSLDVFGIHAVGGIVGAILTGVFAAEAIGGKAGLLEGNAGQVLTQIWGITATIGWCAIATFVILIVVNILVGVRVSQAVEVEGLDINLHGEVVQ
jgi:Amt family ammonium transporter